MKKFANLLSMIPLIAALSATASAETTETSKQSASLAVSLKEGTRSANSTISIPPNEFAVDNEGSKCLSDVGVASV